MINFLCGFAAGVLLMIAYLAFTAKMNMDDEVDG